MSLKSLALFPGQGSQKVGMGKELYEAHALAKEYFEKADKALGKSLSNLCFQGPQEELTATEIAQPAILTVSTICFRLFEEERKKIGASSQIVTAAGHSLGEYSALVASGALAFEDAVLLVHKRGKYMQAAVPAGAGKMAAILGKEVSEIEAAISQVKAGVISIANINAPGQIVVAGAKAAVEELLTIMAGAKAMELPVSAPFHCPLMKPAEDNLAKDLEQLQINKPQFPVYSNYHARPLTNPQEIRDALRLQVCGKVQWVSCMEHAINEFKPNISLEFGYGSVLSGMLKRINSNVPRQTIDSLESAQKALALSA